MQYTLRKIPKAVDAALRRRAKRERKPLNEVAIEAMAEGLGIEHERASRRSLRDVVGALPRDLELEASLEAQRTIDPELWR